MGRISRLRQQRRQTSDSTTGSRSLDVRKDLGNDWLEKHGSKPAHILMRPSDQPVPVEIDEESGTASVFVASCNGLNQVDVMVLLTPCKSVHEAMTIRKVVRHGFSTQGWPQLQKRHYCDELGKWITPIAVDLRLFYDLV
jgi:hypothetical protein